MIWNIIKYLIETWLFPYLLGVLSGYKGNQLYEKHKKNNNNKSPYIESKTDSHSKTISFEGIVAATENASTTISQLQTLVAQTSKRKKNSKN